MESSLLVSPIKTVGRPMDIKVNAGYRTGKVIQMDYACDYFYHDVDPLITECVVYLMRIKPKKIKFSLIEFLSGKAVVLGHKITFSKTEEREIKELEKLQSSYFDTEISPLIGEIMNRIAKSRPPAANLKSFICDQLREMSEEKISEILK